MPDEQPPATLPAAEPTTIEAVKGVLGIAADDDTDDADLARVVAAACLVVRGLPVAQKALGLDAWPANVERGADLLAAGLFPRRKKTTGEPKFVPDSAEVHMLLETGDYAPPRVG